MSNPKKTLGTGLENRAVRRAREKGLLSQKQPLSGILKEHPNDVVIESELAECKVRSTTILQSGHKTLTIDMTWKDGVEANAKRMGYDWGIVIINAKGSREPMVLCSLEHHLSLLAELKHLRTQR